MLDEAGVHREAQFIRARESPSDQLRRNATDQRAHLRMAAFVVGALDIDHPVLAFGARQVELALGRRDALRILETVVVPEQPDEHVAAPHFVEIQLIRATVGGRHVLEQEDLEEAPHQRIATQVIAQGRPLLGELLLHAADENADRGHAVAALPVTTEATLMPFGLKRSRWPTCSFMARSPPPARRRTARHTRDRRSADCASARSSRAARRGSRTV